MPKKGTKSNRNKLYWIELGYSEEDALLESRKRTPGTIEYFKFFKGLSEEDARNASTQFFSEKVNTLENMIRKYGEDIGTLKYQTYCNRQAFSNSFEFKNKRYGWDLETWNKFNKTRGVPGERNGNYGTSYYQVWVDKYGKDIADEMNKKCSENKSHSFDSYLRLNNGDIEKATIQHNQYLIKSNNGRLAMGAISGVSTELFNYLKEYLLSKNQTHFFYGGHNFEWFISQVGCRVIFLDFFFKPNGKVIEFNGDFWHANPNKYISTDRLRCGGFDKTAGEIWEEDENRLGLIKKIPYIKDIKIVWEYDWRKRKMDVIDECIKFLEV